MSDAERRALIDARAMIGLIESFTGEIIYRGGIVDEVFYDIRLNAINARANLNAVLNGDLEERATGMSAAQASPICPDCGAPVDVTTREVSWTMYVPSSWGEDEEYENATRTETAVRCTNPACDYADVDPAVY